MSAPADFSDADVDAADITHSSRAAAASPSSRSAASSSASQQSVRRRGAAGGASDLLSQALAEQAEGAGARSSRKRAVVNYSQMDDDGEGAEGDGDEEEAAAARPAKKRRSGGSGGGSGGAAAAAPKKRRRRQSADGDDDDDGGDAAYEHRDSEGEEEHKGASRKKKRSSGASAAAASGKSRAPASAIAAHEAGADAPPIETLMGADVLGASDDEEGAAAGGTGGASVSAAAARLWASGAEEGVAPYRAPDPTRVAESGIIMSMTLKNFMNHKWLPLEFNPNVNFIHGRNGAGKSSILHAIQVVFGARASETSRGTNMSRLIRHNRDEAEVTVNVKNEGDNAFKHDEYGDVIRIVRHIRRKTASGYELRNGATGALVSRKTSEVHELCAWFNIQVSNPCVIMTQEVSKKFLSSSKGAHEKFEFFQQATQLEWLRSKLQESQGNIAEMVNTLSTQRRKIPDLDEKIKKLQKSEALAQEAETLQQEIVDLSNRLAWRQVHDLEIQFDLKEVERNTHIAALDKARAKRAELEAQFGGAAQLEEAKQKHTAVIERENRRVVELMRAISGKDQDVIRVKNEQKGLISRIDGLKKRIHALQRKKADNDAKIAAIAATNSRDTGAADAQRAKRKDDLLAQKATLQADRAKLLSEMEKLRDKERELRSEATELNTTAHSFRGDMEAARFKLNSAQQAEREAAASAGGAAAAAGARRFNLKFGDNTPRVWQLIDSAHWKVKPVGPLGDYVQVKEASWLKGVTECLTGKAMRSYLVDNFDDQQQLQAILKQVWKERHDRSYLPVITKLPKEQRWAVVNPRVPFPLVIDQLQIDDDWAFNGVVMACKPERFGLHATLLEAVNAIRPFRNLEPEKGNSNYVSGSFLALGDKVSIKGRSGEGSTVSERPREKPLFQAAAAQVNQADMINQLRGRISELEEQLQQATASHQEAAENCRRHSAKHREHAAEAKKLADADRVLKEKLSGVESALADVEEEADQARFQQRQQDDSLLVDDNVRLLNEIGECEGDIAQLRSNDSSHFSERIDALNRERAQLEEQMQASQSLVDQEQSALGSFTVQWARQDVKLKKYRANEVTMERALAELDVAFAAVSAELEKAEGEATKLAPDRVDSDHNCLELMAQIHAKEDTLAEKRARAPINLMQVREDLKAAMLDRARTEAGMVHVLANQQNLQKANRMRVKKLLVYRQSLAQSASFVFNKLLQASGGSGRLEFDTENQLLELIVNPNVHDAERADAANTVVLSGGERSIATIAFMMAVGEQVECPFRAIDEFDVFMDPVTRRVALNLLLSVASLRKDRQFFFLSPLDITDLKSDTYFNIIRLKEPVRNALVDEGEEEGEGEAEGEGEGEGEQPDGEQ